MPELDIPPDPDLAARMTPPADGPFQPDPTPFSVLGEGLMRRIEERGLDKQPLPPPAPGEDPVEREMVRLVERGVPRKAARVVAIGTATAGGLVETDSLQHVMEFMAGPPGTIVISGGVGAGKTVAAAWCVAQRTRERYIGSHPDGRGGSWPVDYRPTFRDVARLLRIPKYGKDADAAMMPLEECALLVIDDAGKNGQADEVIETLIVSRHDNGLRTVITTNLPWLGKGPKDDCFVERYGARVQDRVEESGRHGGGFLEIAESSKR